MGMRTLLLVLALSLSACGKKKPAQSPANSAPAAEPSSAGMDETSKPADPDDAKKTRSSDPCEGGE